MFRLWLSQSVETYPKYKSIKMIFFSRDWSLEIYNLWGKHRGEQLVPESGTANASSNGEVSAFASPSCEDGPFFHIPFWNVMVCHLFSGTTNIATLTNKLIYCEEPTYCKELTLKPCCFPASNSKGTSASASSLGTCNTDPMKPSICGKGWNLSKFLF